MTCYIQKTIKTLQKAVRTNKQTEQSWRLQMNIQKPVAFLYTKYEHSERGIQKTGPSTVTSKYST